MNDSFIAFAVGIVCGMVLDTWTRFVFRDLSYDRLWGKRK